jgi:L-threonylcarbamoyladenylate synthase
MLRVPFTGPDHLRAAVSAVRHAVAEHGIVVIPTETFYGLAVDPRDPQAVDRVFAVKGRPAEKALLVVGASLVQLEELVAVGEPWRTRLTAAWPAPLTVVLKVLRPVAAGSTTLAVRVPAHDLLRELLSRTGPLTATSANRSGEPAPSRPDPLVSALGDQVTVLLDGGRTLGKGASTLIDATCEPPRLLRAGAFTAPASWAVTVV